jgi:hypothetical protein
MPGAQNSQIRPDPRPVTAVVCCSVLEDEVRHFAAGQRHILAIHLLPQGLHENPTLLRRQVQQAIDQIEDTMPHVEVIVLVYGLCSRGTEGVHARRAQLVIARAHDCITLLLGSKDRYADYVKQNPATYWYSPGWNRHHLPPGEERYQKALHDYRARFSEEDVQYLMETEQAWFSQYNRATYVDLGVNDDSEDVAYTRRCADWLGWTFDRQHGDPTLLNDLLCGPWNDQRFLVLQPGQTLAMTADDRIIDRVAVTVNGRPLAEARR